MKYPFPLPPLSDDYKFWEPPGCSEHRYQEADRVFQEHRARLIGERFRQYRRNHNVKSALTGQESVFADG